MSKKRKGIIMGGIIGAIVLIMGIFALFYESQEDYDLRGTRKPSCGTIWHVLHERGLWDFIDCD